MQVTLTAFMGRRAEIRYNSHTGGSIDTSFVAVLSMFSQKSAERQPRCLFLLYKDETLRTLKPAGVRRTGLLRTLRRRTSTCVLAPPVELLRMHTTAKAARTSQEHCAS